MNQAMVAQLLAVPRTFFELMRRVDVLAARLSARDACQVVHAEGPLSLRRPAWLRLEQPARMDFAPAEIANIEFVEAPQEGASARLVVAIRHFGLFAPYGPLPLYITEHAQHEHRAVFEQFFGHLAAEFAWLDFKAWSQLHPVVGCDVKSRGNAFVRRVTSLAAVTPEAPESDREQEHESSRSKTSHHIRACRTHFAGIYVGRHRPLHLLGAMLRKYFRIPVMVRPRTGGWQHIDKGANPPRIAGRWSLGRRVFAPQSAMTILVGPIGADEFPRFQRRQPTVQWMVGVAEDYAGGRVGARIVVDVRTRAGMNGRIGQMRIGVDTWASPVERIVRLTIHEPCMRSASA